MIRLFLCILLSIFSAPAFAGTLLYDDCEDAPDLVNDYILTNNGGTLSVSSEQARAGSKSYKIIYNKGVLGGYKVEFTVKVPPYNLPVGSDNWYGYSIFIPADWQMPDGYDGPIIGQFHTAGDTACDQCPRPQYPAIAQPILVSVTDSQGYVGMVSQVTGMDLACAAIYDGDDCRTDYNYRKYFYSPALNLGHWNDVVIHYVPDYRDVADGGSPLTQIWLNGQKYVDSTGANAHNDPVMPYFKIGFYGSSTLTHVVFVDEIKWAQNASYADVAPGSGAGNVSPTVTISPSATQNISIGDSVYFTCDASDSDGTIASYGWDFDDSGIAAAAVQTPGSKQFTTSGIFTVSVTVTDDDGAIAVDSVVVIVSPTSAAGLQHSWLMEAANIALDDTGGANLTWYGGAEAEAIGSEPYVGLGTHGVALNGSTQYAAATLGASAPWETGTTGTVLVLLQTPATDPGQTKYLIGKYDATGGDRGWAGILSPTGMTPQLNIGVDSGTDYEANFATQGLSPGAKYAIFYSINATAKTWAIDTYDFAGAQWIGANAGGFEGDMHLGASAAFNIGRRSDGSASTYFGGTIYLTRVYNTILSSSDRESIVSKVIKNAGRISAGHGRMGAGYGRIQ